MNDNTLPVPCGAVAYVGNGDQLVCDRDAEHTANHRMLLPHRDHYDDVYIRPSLEPAYRVPGRVMWTWPDNSNT